MSTVILLNGISSSGKTTICKAFQQLRTDPWLHVSMDQFISMLPHRFLGMEETAKQGFHFVKTRDEMGELYTINVGETGNRLLKGMRNAVKALADAGNNIILDEVIYGDEGFLDYAEVLKGHNVYLIEVFCPIEVAEAREIARGDRIAPHTRGQVKVVNKHGYFDLRLNTSNTTADKLAMQLDELLANNSKPSALTALQQAVRRPTAVGE